MSVLEAFSCGTPVMLRDLDLYHSIIKGYYIAADNYAEMDQKLSALVKNPALLRDYQQRADQASAEYSEDHLAEIWLKYYSSLLK